MWTQATRTSDRHIEAVHVVFCRIDHSAGRCHESQAKTDGSDVCARRERIRRPTVTQRNDESVQGAEPLQPPRLRHHGGRWLWITIQEVELRLLRHVSYESPHEGDR